MKPPDLIADDRGISRAGIRALLKDVDQLEVVGEAANGDEVMLLTEKLTPILCCWI
ncbi:MAG: hypothetical protein IPL78_11175 [Chloroflexi bacterium]|nr:hypothetical protein [Chloroflexota bacterium]